MTDPSTPDRPGENDPNPSTPGSPPPPAAPAWGAPPPPPSSPPAPQQPGPQQPGRYDAPQQPPSAYPSPQQGGFPPPPSGGFPPPPQQGAGFPPPPQGYGQPGPGFQQPLEVGGAFSWGFEKFKQNWGTLVLAQLLWGIGIAVVFAIFYAVVIALFVTGADSQGNVSGGVAAVGLVGAAIMIFVVVFVALLSQVGLTNGYLATADGKRPALKEFFVFRHVGAALLASVLVALASFVGALAIYIGALAVGWLAVFVVPLVVDRGLGAIDAIKESIRLTTKNAGQTLALYLLTVVAISVGGAVCGVGALVTAPIAGLATIWFYRRLTSGRVAA